MGLIEFFAGAGLVAALGVGEVVGDDFFLEVEGLEGGVGFGGVEGGPVAEEFAGVGDVEAEEAVGGEGVEEGEVEGGVVDAAFDELLEVFLGDEGVEHGEAGVFGGFFLGLKTADAEGDDGQAFLGGHVAGEGFSEAFGDAVEVAGVDRVGGFDLDFPGVSGDGVDGGGVDDAAAAGGLGGDHHVVAADDVGLQDVLPGGGGGGGAGEVEDGVDVVVGAEAGEGGEVGKVGGDHGAEGGEGVAVLVGVDHEEEVVFVGGVLGEVVADVAGGAGDEDGALMVRGRGKRGGLSKGEGKHGGSATE